MNATSTRKAVNQWRELGDWAVAGGGELHHICFALASGQS
jgi:hypothetical protein